MYIYAQEYQTIHYKMFNNVFLYTTIIATIFSLIGSIQCSQTSTTELDAKINDLNPLDSLIIFGSDNEYSDDNNWSHMRRGEEFVTDKVNYEIPTFVSDHQPFLHPLSQDVNQIIQIEELTIPTPKTFPEHLYILDECQSPMIYCL